MEQKSHSYEQHGTDLNLWGNFLYTRISGGYVHSYIYIYMYTGISQKYQGKSLLFQNATIFRNGSPLFKSQSPL